MYIPETYGSSAYAPVFEPKVIEHREERVEINKKKSRRTVTRKAKRVMLLTAVWSCAVLLLVRNAIITEKCHEVEALSAQLNEAHAQVVQADLELNQEVNLAYVEEYATTELGMVRPTQAQEVYITVRQDDVGEVLTTQKDEGLLATIGNRFLGLLEYLY